MVCRHLPGAGNDDVAARLSRKPAGHVQFLCLISPRASPLYGMRVALLSALQCPQFRCLTQVNQHGNPYLPAGLSFPNLDAQLMLYALEG
ncbi:hypothetical protein GCM10028811_35200 [Uliginosibacterium sediminicola]